MVEEDPTVVTRIAILPLDVVRFTSGIQIPRGMKVVLNRGDELLQVVNDRDDYMYLLYIQGDLANVSYSSPYDLFLEEVIRLEPYHVPRKPEDVERVLQKAMSGRRKRTQGRLL